MKKRLYITFISLLACTLSLFGQSGLVIPSSEWDFGTIAEESEILRHRFVVRNTGKVPEVILDVTATCGCTKPSFSRKPILPGEETVIEVTFQPAGQRGVINRALTLFGDRHQVIGRLTVRGEVIPRKRTIEEQFPVEVGKGVRLSSNHLPFGTVSHGEISPVELRIINTDSRSHHIRFVPEEESGAMELQAPALLAPGEEKRIVAGYMLPAGSRTYGSLRDTYYIEVDGVRQLTRFAARAIAIDAPDNRERRPELKSESDLLRFGEVHHGDSATLTFRLHNEGDAPLAIRAVELPAGLTSTLRAGESIPAGQARDYTLTIESSEADFGSLVERLLVVTNDPKHPLWQPRVVVFIIE